MTTRSTIKEGGSWSLFEEGVGKSIWLEVCNADFRAEPNKVTLQVPADVLTELSKTASPSPSGFLHWLAGHVPTMTRQELVILLTLKLHERFSDRDYPSQRELGEVVGLDKPDMSTGLKKLVKKNLVTKWPTGYRRMAVYRINDQNRRD